MNYIEITLIVIITYLLITRFLKKITYFSFDTLWRVGTMLVIYFLFPKIINLTPNQITTLAIIIAVNFVICMLFSLQKSIYFHLIGIFFAPVMEEMLFRGVVFSAVEGSFEKKVIITSLLFSLYHIKNIFVLRPFALGYQMIYAFFFSIPICFIAFKTQSLFWPIALHSINNMFAATISNRMYPTFFERKKSFS